MQNGNNELIPVTHSNGERIKYLFLRRGSYYIRCQVSGKRYLRSIPHTTLGGCQQWIKTFLQAAKDKRVQALEQSKARRDVPKIGQLCERYLATVRVRGKPRLKTAAVNVARLHNVLRVGTGSNNVDNLDVMVLDGALVRRYANVMVDGVNEKEHAAIESCRRSIVSVLRQARSLFSKDMMSAYRDLGLPDLQEFRTEFACKPEKKRYRMPEAAEIDPVLEAGRALPAHDPLRVVFILAYYLGLRSGEMHAARWSWISKNHQGRLEMDIRNRPEENFKTKGREGAVPIHERVMEELRKCRRPDDPYILPGGTKTGRENLVNRAFASWMRDQGWTRRETAHELRKYRGHLWKKTYGLDAAHDWLRHANWQTTLDYYADIRNDHEPLDMD